MKKILLFTLLVISGIANAQQDAWVYFTDKPDTAYYLANPLEMLTQKALDRRAAHNIALDAIDVPIHQQYIDDVAASGGITVMAKSKWLNALHVRGTQANISTLGNLSFVASIDYADKNITDVNKQAKVQQPKSVAKVSDVTDVAENFSYGQSGTQIEMLNGHLLHQQGYTGAGMTIAILDAGFPGVNTAGPFQRLYDNNLVLGGHNFVGGSEDFYTGGSHGTNVLSTMGGYVEGQLVGTAPDASYYLFITEDVSSENPVEESYWVEAAEMADSLGVDVINTSLGYFDYDNPNYSYTYEDMDGQTAFISRGLDIAFTRGLFCVTSAGNSGASADPYISVPADAVNTLAVGAVTSSEEYAFFSSIGPSYDGRVKPDVMAMGQSATISDIFGTITTASGTSFSGPITAGLVACLWQAAPAKSNAEILQAIKESADRYNNPNDQYGYGIPDFALALTLQTDKFTTAEPFVIYPNPFKNTVSLSLPQGIEAATITLYNNLGQVVWEQNVTTAKPEIAVQNLSGGIYSYRISSANQSQSGRLIKE
ncbi:S8 family serine peptidase [Flavobacterium subsaxonicum]|uniref:Peptidase S8 n=1 Tax=Flavobacterium subsaxonicum WB 4.1-42 = DSM 21790 TaxID=1121898 RepID=A0A0A2MZY1_9FLAO|nr:S8 family serine peptidase [Flavobacterium subsaxonicum]KGO93765.1 peptidase S8 [Flavobacterium subsaxonicum WB 4.1-42 = DSM 21790]